MRATAARRAAVAIGAGALLVTAWGSMAVAAPSESAAPQSPAAVSTSQDAGAKAAQSGTKWCGFNYDKCVQERNAFRHYGHNVGPLKWAGTDNTCPPESACNGY